MSAVPRRIVVIVIVIIVVIEAHLYAALAGLETAGERTAEYLASPFGSQHLQQRHRTMRAAMMATMITIEMVICPEHRWRLPRSGKPLMKQGKSKRPQ